MRIAVLKTTTMKKLKYLLIIVFFNFGCDAKRFLEQIGLEEEITHVNQI